MTESEWLALDGPDRMLRHILRERPRLSPRKLRLFATACVRRLHELFVPGQPYPPAVECAEAFADRRIKETQLRAIRCSLPQRGDSHVDRWVRDSELALLNEDPSQCATNALGAAAWLICDLANNRVDETNIRDFDRLYHEPVALLRDLFGHLFHPAAGALPVPAPPVLALARSIYEERSFNRLPALADALEQWGFTRADIIDHFRAPGPHARGCWALDSLLDLS